MQRVIVGITGASGVILGIQLLKELRENAGLEISLVLSEAAKKNIAIETDYCLSDIYALADHVYENDDFTAPIASGSYQTDAMVVVPCSMKTLAAIAHGFDESLVVRAASVTIKEGRQLILCPRETPLHAIYLENMLTLSKIGVAIVPPMLAFYSRPATVDDMISHYVMKVLDRLHLPCRRARRWEGITDQSEGGR